MIVGVTSKSTVGCFRQSPLKKRLKECYSLRRFFGLAKQAHDDENPVLWILVGWQDTIDGRLFYDQRLARSGQV